MPGLYIHVPFCQKRCHYCSFYSTTFGSKERDAFVSALCEEMSQRATKEVVETIYFGGGTPSQLSVEQVEIIFDSIHRNYTVAADAEITFECNPDDVDTDKIRGLARLGINRISMGVQSFDEDVLRFINRRHTARQAHDAISICHNAGIQNVSIDLIYGLPMQTLKMWKDDLNIVKRLILSCTITHLSSYALSIEPGTHLYNIYKKGEFVEASDDTLLAMYNLLVDTLAEAGFEHYEISNFALPGFESRHNSSYWRQVPYIGLGPGAHSFDGGNMRRYNLSELKRYIAAPCDTFENEMLSPEEMYDELIMTRLRMKEGLPLSLLNKAQREYLDKSTRRYLLSGDLLQDEKRIALTRQGIFISDLIFSDLMWES